MFKESCLASFPVLEKIVFLIDERTANEINFIKGTLIPFNSMRYFLSSISENVPICFDTLDI
jgi:hypothetical protein